MSKLSAAREELLFDMWTENSYLTNIVATKYLKIYMLLDKSHKKWWELHKAITYAYVKYERPKWDFYHFVDRPGLWFYKVFYKS